MALLSLLQTKESGHNGEHSVGPIEAARCNVVDEAAAKLLSATVAFAEEMQPAAQFTPPTPMSEAPGAAIDAAGRFASVNLSPLVSVDSAAAMHNQPAAYGPGQLAA